MERSAPGTKGWDVDLGHGHAGEEGVLELMKGRVEVKRDSVAWRSERVAVEFRYKGHPSGIATSTADWWAFVIDAKDGSISSIVFVATDRLKLIARKCYAAGMATNGGDGNQSEMVLVPLVELF